MGETPAREVVIDQCTRGQQNRVQKDRDEREAISFSGFRASGKPRAVHRAIISLVIIGLSDWSLS